MSQETTRLKAKADKAPDLEELGKEVTVRTAIQNLGHRDTYANGVLLAMAVQLLFSNGIFITYAWAGMHWRVPSVVISGYLAAVAIELIGLVFVVTRHLFPNRDQQDPEST